MMAELVLSASLLNAVPVGDFIPDPSDLRVQEIRRTNGDEEWPFVAERGKLTCLRSLTIPQVTFWPHTEPGEYVDGMTVSTDPFAIFMGGLKGHLVWKDDGDIERIIKGLSPYVVMGERLCDQPPGTVLPDTAL